MTQKFINDYIEEKHCPLLREITKESFDNHIKEESVKVSYAYQILDKDDIYIHPLQKIYVICDYQTSYPSGSCDWGFEFVFKYKSKYYIFSDVDGN